MINNTYKDWFCVDTSVQNDIYRLSGPILVGIWAPQPPLSAQNYLERTWKRAQNAFNPKKMPQNENRFWWRREKGGKKVNYVCRNDFSTKPFPSVVESSVSEVKSFLFYGDHFADNCLPAQMASEITPAFPFHKINHLIKTNSKFVCVCGGGGGGLFEMQIQNWVLV